MLLERPLQFAHTVLDSILSPGDVAVDATAGRGHDTLFLCEQVGEEGLVYAVDIQEDAVQSTVAKLADRHVADRARVLAGDHARLAALIPAKDHGKVRAVCFNLGFLPGSNKEVVTRSESTIKALKASLSMLADGGVVSVMMYPGHPGGDEERDSVRRWVTDIDQQTATVYHFAIVNQANNPPELIMIHKESD